MLQYSFRPNFQPTPCTRTGADQSWVDYDPIVDRPPLKWPNGAHLAVLICPAILDYEFVPPDNPWLNPWARVSSLTRGGYGLRLRCGGPGFCGYSDDRFLSLLHGPADISHQLFEIILGALKLGGLRVHGHAPIRGILSERNENLPDSIEGQSEEVLKPI